MKNKTLAEFILRNVSPETGIQGEIICLIHCFFPPAAVETVFSPDKYFSR